MLLVPGSLLIWRGRSCSSRRCPWPWRSWPPVSFDALISPERALVLVREHLDELGARLGPVVEDVPRAQRAGPLVVVLDLLLEQRLVGQALVPDGRCDARLLLGRTQHPCRATPSPCCSARRTCRLRRTRRRCPPLMPAAKLRPVLPSTTTVPAGHVFAAVVAGAFDHRARARQPHREAFAGHAAEEGLAARRTVEHGVADDDVLRRVATELDATGGSRCGRRSCPCRCSRSRRRSGRS